MNERFTGIHPSAEVNTEEIGEDVTIAAGSVVAEGVVLGAAADVGANCVVGHGATVADGAHVMDGAVVAPGVTIGSSAVVNPLSYVEKDVPPQAIVVGNPAVIAGYVAVDHIKGTAQAGERLTDQRRDIGVGGCQLIPVPSFSDIRGSLTAIEFNSDLPFAPKRAFFVYDVPGREVRGEHAHHECAQFLIALHGSLSVMVDDGTRASEVELNTPTLGLLIPPMVWGVQYKFDPNGVLGVVASLPYDSDDYIRDYAEFLKIVRSEGPN